MRLTKATRGTICTYSVGSCSEVMMWGLTLEKILQLTPCGGAECGADRALDESDDAAA